MKRKTAFQYTAYIVVLVCFSIFLANCGSDEASPTDPSTTSVLPDIVFFNTADPSPMVLFEGRAKDNFRVETVLISFNNGAVWHTTDIDNTSPNTLWDVAWSYLASETDIPAVMNSVLLRAIDADANEVTSSPITLEKQTGGAVGNLTTMFSGAIAGQVIALSSGSGGAYGNGAVSLTIPVNVNLTVRGSGYGNTATSGGLTFPGASSTATILQSPLSDANIFSVDADLTISNMRFIGAQNGIRVSDVSDLDHQLSMTDLVFDGQGAWAVQAVDDDDGVSVQFLSSVVDASGGTSTTRGGLYLESVQYLVDSSEIYFHTDPGGPDDGTDQGAGIQVVGGTGEITDSIFDDNALAIWASGGSPVITLCDIAGAAFTTYGINLTGGPGEAEIRRNTIDGNTGYGLRVGGEMELVLRNNAITSNGLSGVLIDSELNNPSLINIDMGKTSDRGNNLLDNNTHPNNISGFETQVYVTQATQEGSTWIPANWNYWGYSTPTEVDFAGVDDGENGGGRATLGIGNFWASLNSEVGP